MTLAMRKIETVTDPIADLLDDMAALGQHWERNRQRGRMPAAIRLAMISTAEDILSATFISESNAQTDDLVDALKADCKIKGKGRIKPNTKISQDFGIFRWPNCKPPHPHKNSACDPDMEFDVVWDGKWWECTAPGYGKSSDYGNGSILVSAFDGVVLTSSLADNSACPTPPTDPAASTAR